MCNLRHQVSLIFAFSFVSISHGSVLSSGIANHVSGLTTQSLINAQKSKSFLVVDESVLIASDPSGREPDDLITSSPNEGDTLSILHLDKAAGRIFYKVIWAAGERVESRGLFGEDLQVLVPFTKSAIYSESHQKLYWTRDDAVRSIRLDGSDHSIVAKQSDVYTNDLTGWAWLGIYPWVYDQGEDDWSWMEGDISVLRQPTGQWHHDLPAAGVNGWTWWGAYPWVYVNGFASWVYIHGDLWTYSNKNSNWDLLENTSAPVFEGKPSALTLDESSNSLYFQLEPSGDTTQSFGNIEKLNLSTGAISTVVEMANATNIHILSQSDRIYWSEADGLHTASLDGSNRAHILSISKTGEPKPVIYQNPVPVTPGAIYNLTLTPHDTNNIAEVIELKHETKSFNLGTGKDFIAGNYTWFRREDKRQAVLTLSSDQPVNAFDSEGNRYSGWSVEDILSDSGGTKDLPARITLTLTYRDNHTGTYSATRYLASQNVEYVNGDFTGLIGDFSGVPFPLITPQHYESHTITALSVGSDGNLHAVLRDDVLGGTKTLLINPSTQQVQQ